MADTDAVFQAVGQIRGVELRALIPNLRGVQRAVDCGCKKVKLNVSASRQHNLKNLNMTPEQSVAGFADCVKAAQENGLEISGSISMPFGSPWDGRIAQEEIDAIIDAYLNVGITEISVRYVRHGRSEPGLWDVRPCQREVSSDRLVAPLSQHPRPGYCQYHGRYGGWYDPV